MAFPAHENQARSRALTRHDLSIISATACSRREHESRTQQGDPGGTRSRLTLWQ